MGDETVAIPRARIKRVMKADEEIKQIKPDAVLLVGKATELFVELLVESAFRHSQSEKRKGLMYKDLAATVKEHERFDFLLDIIPARRQAVAELRNAASAAAAATAATAADDDGKEPEAKRQKTFLSEEDLDIWLPFSNIQRIAKATLNRLGNKPPCEKEAYQTCVRAATVFVTYLTACAEDPAIRSCAELFECQSSGWHKGGMGERDERSLGRPAWKDERGPYV